LHGLADYYKEKRIFSNAFYGFIAEIVGIVAAGATLFYIIFYTSVLTDFLQKIYPGWTKGDWAALAGMTPSTSNIGLSDVTPLIGSIVAVLAILWVFTIVSAFLNRQSLKALSTKANVGLFSTGALILLIGAVLTIILLGFVIMWIAVLLIVVAFFQLKPQPEQPVATMAPPPLTPTPV